VTSTARPAETRASAPSRQGEGRRVVILVENLPVPFDRRVWQESRALRDAGYEVTVICPRTAGFPSGRERLEGIDIRRYRPWLEADTNLGFLVEYGVALAAMFWHLLVLRLRGRIDVIQACNPPDLLFLAALPFTLLGKTAFIFDHHDVSPELLEAKGKSPTSRAVRFAKVLERLTFRVATVSIATNESYRQVAVERGGMDVDDVFVVRSGPDLSRFAGGRVRPELRRGADHLVAYVGVMGVQEGLHELLEAASLLVRAGRSVQFCLVGDGPERPRLLRQLDELQLTEHVQMPGRIPDQALLDVLATADLCVNPDTPNPMNDMSTMNKILEYMSVGKPIVQFDLREGRFSAQDASLYVEPGNISAFAYAIGRLLDDPELARTMGERGRARLRDVLAWDKQVPVLLAAYERAVSGTLPSAFPNVVELPDASHRRVSA
jgi:glycosyltransferase involved in cell wall biosynthesis